MNVWYGAEISVTFYFGYSPPFPPYTPPPPSKQNKEPPPADLTHSIEPSSNFRSSRKSATTVFPPNLRPFIAWNARSDWLGSAYRT